MRSKTGLSRDLPSKQKGETKMSYKSEASLKFKSDTEKELVIVMKLASHVVLKSEAGCVDEHLVGSL